METALLPPLGADVDKSRHRTCLQCGVCTASCGLSEDGDLFPRREMSLVQSGLVAKAASSPTIWHCYQCDDCTEGCPSSAKPSEVMADLRKRAVESYAVPRAAAKWVNTPRGFATIVVLSSALTAALTVLFGTPFPSGSEVVFRKMLPHSAIIGFYGAAVLLSIVAMSIGLRRIWTSWSFGSNKAFSVRTLGKAFIRATTDMILHRRFSKCKQHPYRGIPHAALIAGFAGLSIMAGIATLLLWTRGISDFPLLSPFKIAANLFALLLVVGLGLLLVQRIERHRAGHPGTFFDWAFLVNLLVTALSGVAVEGMRYASLGTAAYALYFVHLTSVFLFLALSAHTKLAHAIYRFAAEIFREARAIYAIEKQRPATDLRAASTAALPATFAEASAVVPFDGSLTKLSPSELSALPDNVLIDGYNRIRDRIHPETGNENRPFYPGIREIFNTALEREKDRREMARRLNASDKTPIQQWYEDAAEQSCVWWIENHLLMKHSLKSCMFCGMCTAVCPAAEHYADYNPRGIVDVALSGDENAVQTLLKSEVIWYCGQCGSCKERCTRENSVMGIISSLRQLAEIKGYHLYTTRGRQQYAGRHLWAGNFWNRGCSLYFRNGDPESHPDFGPAYNQLFDTQEEEFLRVGAHPDRDGIFGGRKIRPESLEELRQCAQAGGSLFLWQRIDAHGAANAAARRMDLETYLTTVRKEG